jgi:hypothetical protein
MVSPIGFADIGKASYSTGDSADAGSFREAFVGTVVFPLFSTYLLQFHLSILDLSCGCGRIPKQSSRNILRVLLWHANNSKSFYCQIKLKF